MKTKNDNTMSSAPAAMPELTVIWIAAEEEALNQKTWTCVKEEISSARWLIYHRPNAEAAWQGELRERSTCMLCPLEGEYTSAEIYNDARGRVSAEGYVFFVESGDSFPRGFFRKLQKVIQEMSARSKAKWLVGMPRKVREDGSEEDLSGLEENAAAWVVSYDKETYGEIPYFFAGTLLDAAYFIAHPVREDLLYDCETAYLMDLLLTRGKMLFAGELTYTFHRPTFTDVFSYPGYYDRRWYETVFRGFWAPYLARVRKDLPAVPSYIQYLAYAAIICCVRANLNNRNKHLVSEDQVEDYFGQFEAVLGYVEDYIILNMEQKRFMAGLDRNLMLFFLRVKYHDSQLQYHLLRGKNDWYYGFHDMLSASMNRDSINIQFMECKDNVLHIDGMIPALFDLQTGEVFLEYRGKRMPLRYCDRYSHTKLFGTSIYKHTAFSVDLPLADVKSASVRFVYLREKVTYSVRLSFESHFSRLSKLYHFSHCFFSAFGKRILARFTKKDSSISLVQVNAVRACAEELLLWANMLCSKKNLEPGMLGKTLGFLLLRMAYFVFLPLKRKPIWMFIDKIYKGGDCSEYLYRYSSAQNDGIRKYYLIDKKTPDYRRLRREGYRPLVRGTLKHKLLFLYADMMVISNSTVFAFNGYDILTSQYIRDLVNFHVCCVQHGMSVQKIAVAQNRLRDNIRLYFCASKYEIDNLIRPVYDYDGYDALRLTGVPRHDGLINEDKRQLIFSPTWRMQAAVQPTEGNESLMRAYNPQFKNTDYYKVYNALINDERLIAAAKKYGYRILYVLHPIVSSQICDFDTNDYTQIVASTDDFSYEKAFRESSLMVTDASGVQFDFAYMRKPVVYLHHKDIPQHYEEGSFFYETMGFGEICTDNDELVTLLIEYMKNDCRMKPEYSARADDFFAYSDQNNCQRCYEEMIKYMRS